LFSRPPHSYTLDPAAAQRVIADPATPLHCIAELIAPGSVVLDIGAGNGLLADVITGFNKNIIVDGIEPDPNGSTVARPKYRNFYQDSAETRLKSSPMSSNTLPTLKRFFHRSSQQAEMR
jgi:predicted RNA methylase